MASAAGRVRGGIQKADATGIDGCLGNRGVSVVQLLTPILITSSVLAIGAGQKKADGSEVCLQNAAFVWVPALIVLAAVAWSCRNGLKAAATPFTHRTGQRLGLPEAQAAALKQSEMEAGAVTGFSSAIAAYGFFFIPATSAAMAVTSALWMFTGSYATCLAVCWWFYARQGAEAPS
ncbi:hypothetical protein [Streptomyces sp. NPDC060031]|uniref:hypothetical protein n=1 Tax=Streptomyces sp. NPDC060031 TaxID=3347043 RepID=UPI0036A37EFC